MSRKSCLIAAALFSSIVAWATGAQAAPCTSSMTSTPHGKPVWVGVLRFVTQSSACGTSQFFGKDDIARSIYRPYLTTGDNPSGLSHYLGNNHSMLITNTTSATAQFNGTGTYRLCGISEMAEFSGPINGSYAFTQVPAVVDANTTFITLSGRIHRYGNIAGCSLFFQGIFVRDPTTVP